MSDNEELQKINESISFLRQTLEEIQSHINNGEMVFNRSVSNWLDVLIQKAATTQIQVEKYETNSELIRKKFYSI